MSCNLSVSVTSELPSSQRKEREDPEAVQDRLTELLNSIKPELLGVTITSETGSVEKKKCIIFRITGENKCIKTNVLFDVSPEYCCKTFDFIEL